MLALLRKIIEFCLSLLFPHLCVNCKENIDKGALCSACLQKININSGWHCPVCNMRLPFNKKHCYHSSYNFGNATVFNDETIRSLVHAAKFNRVSDAAKLMGEITVSYLKTLSDAPRHSQTIIIPLPLSKRRLRERGFNQSEIIAQHIAAYLNTPITANCLHRHRHTLPQAHLKNKAARDKNISGCFSLTAHGQKIIPNKHLIVVDDVLTTGATMNEAVRVLKTAHPQKITVIVFAKA